MAGGLTGSDMTRMLRAAGLSTSGLVASPGKLADMFNDAMLRYGDGLFTTRNRVAALVSECMVESAWFRTTQEYPNQYQHKYAPYIGRGFIQCTWRDNYAAFGKWCKAKGLVDDADYFVESPARLADLKWAALTGVWYFTHVRFDGKPLVEYANNIRHVGRAVNNGNPFTSYPARNEAERIAAYNAVRALGKSIVPTPPPGSVKDEGSKDVVVSEHIDVFPTLGKIQVPFGKRGPHWSTDAASDPRGWGIHTGDDWHRSAGSKENGDPVYAVADGRVIYAGNGRDGLGWGSDFGNQVLIEWAEVQPGDGGRRRTSLDAHLSSIGVKYNDRVTAGEQIGRKGATGNVTGVHVHHEQHFGNGWGDRKVRPIYPGRTIVQTVEIEQDFLDMAEELPLKRRKKNQLIPPTKNGKPRILRLEDSGDVTWAFGEGKYEIQVFLRFEGGDANDELLVCAVQQDTQKGKKYKPHFFHRVGLKGGHGTSFTQFTWKKHVGKPRKGRTRRMRLAVENYTGKNLTVTEVATRVWRAEL